MSATRETVDANSASLDPLWEAAVFGHEVKNFIDEHPVAKFIVEKAAKDLEAAHVELVAVDPTDARKIAQLQLDARVATRITTWLAEAVQNGRAATAQLQEEQDEHGQA